MLKRWDRFARFFDDGRICLSNNAAERCLRGIALGRRSWLFAGSDRGGRRAAAMYTLIGTAKLNDVDPQAWLADAPVKSFQPACPTPGAHLCNGAFPVKPVFQRIIVVTIGCFPGVVWGLVRPGREVPVQGAE